MINNVQTKFNLMKGYPDQPEEVSYYGAFVIDPEGNNIEAVCHLAG